VTLAGDRAEAGMSDDVQTPTPGKVERPLAPPALRGRQRLIALAGVLLSILIAALDQTIVGTALPRIVAELGGFALYSWVVTAYLLTATCAIPIAGTLSDQFGRKPILLFGVVVFVLGSVLCGAAGQFGSLVGADPMLLLVLFRGLQGIGAGALQSGAFASIGDLFAPAERGRWQGVIAGTFGIASLVGPSLGGWITDTFGWPWIFYVNLPVGICAFATLWYGFPARERSELRATIDWPGVTTIVAAVAPLLVALTWAGSTYPWASPQVLGALGLSALMVAAFVLVERRAAEPLLPLDLFRNRIFTAAAVASFFLGPLLLGLTIYLPLFVQGVLLRSATTAGLILTPFTLGSVVTNILGGQLVSRTGHYKWIALAGAALTTIGVALLLGMGIDTDNASLIRNMLLAGCGLGLMLPQYTIAVQNALPYGRLGVVTSSVQFTRSIGSTIGISALGAIVVNTYAAGFAAHAGPGVRAALAAAAAAGHPVPSDPQVLASPGAGAAVLASFIRFAGPTQGTALYHQFLVAVQNGLLLAVHDVFLALLVLALLALVATLFLNEIPLRRTYRPAAETPAAPAAEPVVPR
jgi:EmrB/QacA subfamily drug resistance transporter